MPSDPHAFELPIRVAVADLERLPDEITAQRPEGGTYHGLWLLVRAGGAPVALLRLAFDGAPVSRAAIERALGSRAPAPAAPAPADPAAAPLISVVVCTMLSRAEDLRACLRSLAALDYPNHEILLVDNRPPGAPEDAGEWIAREAPGVRLLREVRPGASAARNRGLAEAAGEIVAFTDDDVVVDPGWLSAFARRFAAHPHEACATGLVLPNNLETEAQGELERFYGGFGQRRLDPVSHRLAPGRGPLAPPLVEAVGEDGTVVSSFLLFDFGKFGAGANMAFRVADLRALGGFDVRLGPGTPTHSGEELCVFAALAWRGRAVAFVPSALVFHAHRRDLAGLRHQIRCYGVGYTAAILALTLSDPRLALAATTTLPFGGFALARAQAGKLRRSRARTPPAPDAPRQDAPRPHGPALARTELAGMVQGPAALVRSALRTRRGGHG